MKISESGYVSFHAIAKHGDVSPKPCLALKWPVPLDRCERALAKRLERIDRGAPGSAYAAAHAKGDGVERDAFFPQLDPKCRQAKWRRNEV